MADRSVATVAVSLPAHVSVLLALLCLATLALVVVAISGAVYVRPYLAQSQRVADVFLASNVTDVSIDVQQVYAVLMRLIQQASAINISAAAADVSAVSAMAEKVSQFF